MQSVPFFSILFPTCVVILGINDLDFSAYTTISFRISNWKWYNWTLVATTTRYTNPCHTYPGGWNLFTTAECQTSCPGAPVSDCFTTLTKNTKVRKIMEAALQVCLVKMDGSTINITHNINYLSLNNYGWYIVSPTIQFFGVADVDDTKNPLICNSTGITSKGSDWIVAFQYKLCQNVPIWLKKSYTYELGKQDLTFAEKLLGLATSVNMVIECTNFNHWEKDTIKFTQAEA